MKKINVIIILITLFAIACTNTSNKLSEQEIDEMVELILDSNQVYEVNQSLKFSNNAEQYNVLEYSKNDTTILYVETLTGKDKEYTRELYYNKGKVIFIIENGYRFINQDNEEQYQQKRYFLSINDSISFDKTINIEDSNDYVEMSILETINYNKPFNAINQKEGFEMKFGEFLTIDPQSFLILENKESEYNVALFITQGDYLLDELYENPAKYKGTTIFAHHEYANIGGIVRMIYKGGILIEN
jgi:ABC-type Fe3+-citrate transport system substrate-binding protein